MKADNAADLIKKAFKSMDAPLIWADFGCGNGTFTKALLQILPSGSEIIAIDKVPQLFDKVTSDVTVRFQLADFEKDGLILPPLNGILIANALHYIKDKIPFITKLKKHLQPSGKLLIIEYDTEASNPWVPYPINFNNLTSVVLQAGFSSIEKMAEVSSIYNNGKIYSCVIK